MGGLGLLLDFRVGVKDVFFSFWREKIIQLVEDRN
jgi:hypothetical protein